MANLRLPFLDTNMTTEQRPIDLATMPDVVAQLVEEVERTRQPRQFRRGNRTVAVLMPATPLDEGYQSIPALDPPRSWDEVTATAAADPLWAIIGTVESTGATDVSENVDRYLADAAAPPP